MIAARTIGGLVDPETIEEMEKDLTKVIDDFDRAVNLEALRRIKETGKRLIVHCDNSFSIALFRAGAPALATQICGYDLSPEFGLYGRYPRIPPQTADELGD